MSVKHLLQSIAGVKINTNFILPYSMALVHDRLPELKDSLGDLPGGSVIKNPPSNAEDVGSIPGRGTKIPHALGQPSPHSTGREQLRCPKEEAERRNSEKILPAAARTQRSRNK